MCHAADARPPTFVHERGHENSSVALNELHPDPARSFRDLRATRWSRIRHPMTEICRCLDRKCHGTGETSPEPGFDIESRPLGKGCKPKTKEERHEQRLKNRCDLR